MKAIILATLLLTSCSIPNSKIYYKVKRTNVQTIAVEVERCANNLIDKGVDASKAFKECKLVHDPVNRWTTKLKGELAEPSI